MQTFENTTIVVTGGAGAIGSTLLRRLLEQDPKKIVVIDNLTSGNLEFIPKDDRIEFHNIDIANKEKLTPAIPYETNYIFHLAAHFANQNSVDFPHSDIKTNVIGTLNLLELCHQNTGKLSELRKFVNASSSCVYSDSKIMSIEDNIYPSETPYAINKLTGELYTKNYSELHGVPAVSIRIFNTYGPFEMGGKYRNVIPNFIDKALKNESIRITGTGKETRDFTYCDDTCNLLELAALSKVSDGSVYNGGTGIKTTIEMLARLITVLCESTSKIEIIPRRNWDNISDRLSDISKSKEELGYIPSHTNLQKNLQKTIEWYKEQL